MQEVAPVQASRITLFVGPAIALLSATLLYASADKTLPVEEMTNDQVDITASAMLDRDQIKQEVGYDLGPDIVVLRVSVRNVTDKPVQIDRDDFYLLSTKDFQRSEPYEPGQIAGADSLNVTPTGMRKGSRLGGLGVGIGLGLGGGIGGGGGAAPTPDPKVEDKRDDKTNPELSALKAKVLPETPLTGTASGLLYFQIVGKVRPKDLELHYKGPGGKLALRFDPKK